MRRLTALFLATVVLAAVPAAPSPLPPAVATLALLTDAAEKDGAVFLDGSPAARYIVRGDPARWLIYQQGGGWCSNDVECLQRANSTLGSSKTYPNTSTTVMQENDYLSNDPAVNPQLHSWTKVYLSYGDGSSQTSDIDEPQVVGDGVVYYRGARVLRAMIAFLLAEGLSDASEVIITGCSAGGLSTYLHADKWAAALPSAAVKAMPDSGFFLNFPTSNSSHFPANTSYPWRMWWTATRQNATAALPPACVAAQPPSDFWLCMFAENVAPFITTPTFALQSYHDSYQIAAILGVRNSSDPAQFAAINAYGATLAGRLEASLIESSSKHGAALDACTHHCGARVWDNITFPPGGGAGAVSQGDAFAAWYAGGSTALYMQAAQFPCADCCRSEP